MTFQVAGASIQDSKEIFATAPGSGLWLRWRHHVAGEGTRGTIEPEVRQVDANAGLSPRGCRVPARLRAGCFCRWPDLT